MSDTLTAAEKSCRRAGYCVFTLAAPTCSICGRTRDGKRPERSR